MAGVGDAKAHKYVIKELIRRTLGVSPNNKAVNFAGEEEMVRAGY